MDIYDNEKRQSLDGSKKKTDKYILFSFIASHLLPQKESNYKGRLTSQLPVGL